MQIQKPKQGYKLVKSLFGKYKEIPEEWNVTKLSEVGDIVGGGTPDSTKKEYWNGNIWWAIPTDITKLSGNFTDKTERTITELGLKESSAKLLPPNSILVTSRATIGECAINLVPMSTNQGFQSIICNSKNNNLFIFYAIKFHKNTLLRLAYGTTFLEISKSEMKKVEITVPELYGEQQKIASILSNVDSLIQQTQKEMELTQKLKKGLMQRLFTKGIGHTKFKEIKFGAYFIREKIPESWKIDTVKNSSEKMVVGFVGICEPYYVENGGIPLLRTTNIKEGKFDLSNLKYVTKEFHEHNKKSQVKEGDILVSRHGVNGEACLVRNITEANCLNIVIIRPKEDLFLPEFFELAFNSPTVRRQIQRTTGGGVQDVVNTSEIGKAKMIIPDLNEQSKILSIFSNLRIQIQEQQEYKSKLVNLKKGLMQKLLTGQIRVRV